MKRLRFEQRKNEPAEIFGIRCFLRAADCMDDNALRAATKYLVDRVSEELRLSRIAKRENA